MGRVKPEHYKVAYNKLYGFIRRFYPQVLEHYRKHVKEIREKVEAELLMLEEVS